MLLKKMIFSTVPALFCILNLSATPVSKNIYFATVSRVDTHGSYLFYRRSDQQQSASRSNIFASLPAEKAALANALMATLSPLSIEAFAASDICHKPGVHVYKQFFHLGKNMSAPGIFEIVPPGNQAVEFDKLPKDTAVALSVTLHPKKVAAKVRHQLQTTPGGMEFLKKLDELKNSGVDVFKLLDSLDGNFFLLISGNSRNNFGIRAVLPDRNGVLTEYLKALCPPTPGSNIAPIPVNAPAELPDFAPQFIYNPGSITFVSKPEMIKSTPGLLTSHSPLRERAQYLPKNGYGYAYINFNAQTGNLLAALCAAIGGDMQKRSFTIPEGIPFPEFFIAAVAYRAPEGFGSVLVSDFSVSETTTTMPLQTLQLINTLMQKGK